MKEERTGSSLPLTPEILDRQAALSDARLVLGVIEMLEHLDERPDGEPLDASITRLESWLGHPGPSAEAGGKQLFGGLLG